MKPALGETVLFRSAPEADPEVALVCAVHSDTSVNLTVCDRSGGWRPELAVEIAPEPDGPSWSWRRK